MPGLQHLCWCAALANGCPPALMLCRYVRTTLSENLFRLIAHFRSAIGGYRTNERFFFQSQCDAASDAPRTSQRVLANASLGIAVDISPLQRDLASSRNASEAELCDADFAF